jgi:hypothetical protein
VLKHNFIKIIAFILISSFFFSSSVYAKMQAMSEDDLMQIDAETGITIDLNTSDYLKIYLKAARVSLYTASGGSGIILPNLVIDGTIDTTTDNYTNPTELNINSTLVLDVGTTSGKTWVRLSGINIYNALGITSKGIWVDGASDWILGDLYIRGLFMGRTLTSGTSGYNTPKTDPDQTFTYGGLPTITLSARNQGLDLFASLNLYVNTLEYRFRPASSTNELKLSSIYACNTFSGTVETPSTWVGSGNLSLGNYTGPYSSNVGYATMDVGTLSGKTYLNLNLPLAGSIRIYDFRMDSAFTLGPVAVDGLVTKSLSLTLYSL